MPKISINIPLIIDGTCETVLNSIRNIDYPNNLYEIIIVEGNHIAKQRNSAIKHSRGEIIYLLDDDSRIQPDSLKILAQEFATSNVAAVGGPSLAVNKKNYLSLLIAYALETYFGAMRMRFRYAPQEDTSANEYHLIGANLALRKKVVEKIGMFNEKIIPNEETELLRRLKKSGYVLKYTKRLSIFREQRKTFNSLARQFHYYGVGRMKQILYNGSLDDFLFIIPIAFALYLISLFFYRPFWYLLPLIAYSALGFVTSLKAAIKYKRLDIFFTLALIFPVIHLSYSLGLITQLVGRFLFSSEIRSHRFRMKVRIIKSFNSWL